MSKRANGEGSIRQRPNGRWEGRLSYVDPATELRKSVSVYGASAAETRSKLKVVRQRLDDGQPAKDSAMTVGAWCQTWRDSALEASDRKATTRALYGGLSRKHLEAGTISRKPLDKLKATDVESLIVALRKSGLSESTVRQIYTVLRAAMEIAVRDGLLGSNPVAKVPRPKVTPHEAKHLSADEVKVLLEQAKSSRYFLAVLLMATTGLRRGEVVGLAWSDVDMEQREIRVRHTLNRVDGELVLSEPKTARSRRRIPLLPSVVAELRSWRLRQKQERLRAGDQWADTGMVFTTELGTMVDPRNLLRVVSAAAKAAGLEDVVAHSLRHSAAVAMLEAGVHIKAVADLLGHSSISITGDIYGHTSDDAAKSAIASLGEALGT
ncbi:site-specific integrase [Gordonia defluvii]|uniref:Site-specific integrase n=1 Tax=Gordonia defluvii TaxID=283718 RepID=A0ABP6LJ19_9ACTN